MGWFDFFKMNKILRHIEQLTRHGELQQAEQLLKPLIEQRPQDATLRLYAATIEFERQQYQIAQQHIEVGLKLQVDNPVMHLAMGEVLWQQKKYPEASQALKQALLLSPGNPKAEYLLGLTCIAMQRLDEATMHFEQVAREDKHFLMARLLTLAEAMKMADTK